MALGASAAAQGDLVKSRTRPDVYLVNELGGRDVFPNESVFFSWENDFDSVITLSDEEIADLPIGRRMRYKPCTYLVKSQTNPDVYHAGESGMLRRITSETQASTLFGANWPSLVRDVSDVFWLDYVKGEDFDNSSGAEVCPNDGDLIPNGSSARTGWTKDVILVNYVDRENIVWPTESTTLQDAFGPRMLAGQYDFHRGIDIAGETGDLVYSIDDGTVYRIYHEGEVGSPFKNGGNVVILKHEIQNPINFLGRDHVTYFSYYLHLDQITIPDIAEDDEWITEKGMQIGTLGASGTANTEHLHLETRIGEFGTLDDASVNPFLYLSYNNINSLQIEPDTLNESRFLITSDREELDVNAIYITSGADTRIINFSTREGIDPNNRDNNIYNSIVLEPLNFNKNSDKYEMYIEYIGEGEVNDIKVIDIFGNGVRLYR
ncbi:M23 family metallopeptidase [Candidatus Uhrbacteria bacterium]|nr:M23 family metallopeptidase [Candidatus Uhrbacteria bacterium]